MKEQMTRKFIQKSKKKKKSHISNLTFCLQHSK